jgi:hypothetical protein
MFTIEEKDIREERISRTYVELRRTTLQAGGSFLCLEEHLPADQAIHEYPDGRFQVESVTSIGSPRKFHRLATASEIESIKRTNPAYGD